MAGVIVGLMAGLYSGVIAAFDFRCDDCRFRFHMISVLFRFRFLWGNHSLYVRKTKQFSFFFIIYRKAQNNMTGRIGPQMTHLKKNI